MSQNTQKDKNLQGAKALKLAASVPGNGVMMLPSELLFGALCGISFCSAALFSKIQISTWWDENKC